ncbi:unnamed protein product [Prunus armeniaca]
MHGRSKHIDVRFHFLRDLARDEVIKLEHCPSNMQVADILTKPLKLEAYIRMREALGICSSSRDAGHVIVQQVMESCKKLTPKPSSAGPSGLRLCEIVVPRHAQGGQGGSNVLQRLGVSREAKKEVEKKVLLLMDGKSLRLPSTKAARAIHMVFLIDIGWNYEKANGRGENWRIN